MREMLKSSVALILQGTVILSRFFRVHAQYIFLDLWSSRKYSRKCATLKSKKKRGLFKSKLSVNIAQLTHKKCYVRSFKKWHIVFLKFKYNTLSIYVILPGAHGEGQPGPDAVCGHHRQVSTEDWPGGEPGQDGAPTGQFFFNSVRRKVCIFLTVSTFQSLLFCLTVCTGRVIISLNSVFRM